MLQELQPGDPRLIGPYRVVGLLGDGGMGRVFLGRSAGGRPVALKVIRRDLAADPDFRQRFRREVAAARKVSGLYTAMVIDADVDAPEPWLATAYVEGPSLYEAVNDHGPLPLGSVLALAGGLAESLTAIHAAGVVHRDLKPSNVLLGRDGPYLIDFGISRAAESTSLTRAGFVIGSPGFMSPEQAEGGEVGPASDIFSLGAVLAFAASGQHPFGAGSTAALVYRVVYAPPNLDGVPEEIRPLIERCLAKDPGQRPAASEVLREAEAAQPMTEWLPEPITRTLQDYRAVTPLPPPVVTPPAPVAPPAEVVTPPAEMVTPPAEAVTPPPVAADEPSKDVLTVTGMSALAVPESAPPLAAAEAAVLKAQTAPAEAEPALPEAQTAPPEAETGAPAAKAAVPEAQTGPQADKAAAPEADTAVPALVASGAATALGPMAGPGPHPAAEPPPWADVPPRPRRRLARPLVLASAAAVILIGSAVTALALSSSPTHTPASHGGGTATAGAPLGAAAPAQLATSSSSASAARTAPHSSAPSSGRPAAQPTTHAATTQAPATVPTTSAPTQQSSPKPTPKPTHKPTPQPTHTAALSVSVSGGSEESCGAIGSLHPSQGASVAYTFSDQSSASVQIAYIDDSGAEVSEGTLGPGQVYTPSTYVGAYWVVETSGGSCLAVVGVDGSGQATVT